jgi:exopolysaccharide production protein ExoZ
MSVPATPNGATSSHGGRDHARKKYDGLEVGRGFAAIFVLISHTAEIVAEPRFYGRMPWGEHFLKFGAGVDYFFVLSGFIIAWAHLADIGRPDRLGHYASRRFRRIFPPYWAVLLPLSCAYFLMPSAGKPGQHDIWNFFFSVTLLPYPVHPILGVAWTLVYEMIFYAIFGIAIWKGRPAFVLLWLWGAAVLVANLVTKTMAFPFSILFDSLNLEFLMGVSAAICLRRYRIPIPEVLAVLGFAAFLTILLIDYPVAANPLLMRIGYGLSATIGILGLVETERSRGLPTPKLLRTFGAASYAIYLVHGIAISVAIQLVVRLTHRLLPLPLVMLILIGAGIAAGLLFHFYVETPLARWMKKAPRSAGAVAR